MNPTDYVSTAEDIANEATRLAWIAKRNRRDVAALCRRRGSRSLA